MSGRKRKSNLFNFVVAFFYLLAGKVISQRSFFLDKVNSALFSSPLLFNKIFCYRSESVCRYRISNGRKHRPVIHYTNCDNNILVTVSIYFDIQAHPLIVECDEKRGRRKLLSLCFFIHLEVDVCRLKFIFSPSNSIRKNLSRNCNKSFKLIDVN